MLEVGTAQEGAMSPKNFLKLLDYVAGFDGVVQIFVLNEPEVRMGWESRAGRDAPNLPMWKERIEKTPAGAALRVRFLPLPGTASGLHLFEKSL